MMSFLLFLWDKYLALHITADDITYIDTTYYHYFKKRFKVYLFTYNVHRANLLGNCALKSDFAHNNASNNCYTRRRPTLYLVPSQHVCINLYSFLIGHSLIYGSMYFQHVYYVTWEEINSACLCQLDPM